MKIFNGRIPLLCAVIVATPLLGACSGGGSGTADITTTSSAVKVTAMKGKFNEGSTVIVRLSSNNNEVVRGLIGADGSVSVDIPTTATGPFLIEAGIAGDQYFDESTNSLATIPTGGTGLRALITSATASPSVGVTALTEMAVAQVAASAGGISGATATLVMAANTTVGIQFGVDDPLLPPSVISSGITVDGTSAADSYALKLAGLAKMAGTGVPAMQAMKDLSADMADGKLNGLIGTAPITSLNFIIHSGGVTIADMGARMAAQVALATGTYAPGATAPTITLTVQDLAALLQAAYDVGTAAQLGVTGLSDDVLNAQIAATLQAQVQTISTAVGAGTSIATATATAVAAAGTTATTLANAVAAGPTFMASLKTGHYNSSGRNSSGNLEVQKETATEDASGKLTFADMRWELNTTSASSSSSWASVTKGGNSEWQLGTTGWVKEGTESVTIATNANGTISYLTSTGQSGSFLPKVTTLDGTLVDPCANPSTYNGMTIPATCTATYPTGSVGYETFGHVQDQDAFWLEPNWNGGINTDANGVELTTMPTLGTGFCINDHYYRPIPSPLAGANNYDVIYSYSTAGGACNAANIAVAQTSTSTNGSVLVVNKATGNTSVSTVMHIARATDSTTGQTSWLLNRIMGSVSSKVYMGEFQAAGPTDWDDMNFNKIAMDANVAVFGAPAIP